MKDVLHWVALTFFVAIVGTIVFVRAGQKTGISGGQQASTLLQGGGAAVANVTKALEGG